MQRFKIAFKRLPIRIGEKNVVFTHLCFVIRKIYCQFLFVYTRKSEKNDRLATFKLSDQIERSFLWDLSVKITLSPTINNGILYFGGFFLFISFIEIKYAKICKVFFSGCHNNPTKPNWVSECLTIIFEPFISGVIFQRCFVIFKEFIICLIVFILFFVCLFLSLSFSVSILSSHCTFI